MVSLVRSSGGMVLRTLRNGSRNPRPCRRRPPQGLYPRVDVSSRQGLTGFRDPMEL